jgi:hypothetical protein
MQLKLEKPFFRQTLTPVLLQSLENKNFKRSVRDEFRYFTVPYQYTDTMTAAYSVAFLSNTVVHTRN